jgi:glycosyltransferase involved in cell wall biosynthesis
MSEREAKAHSPSVIALFPELLALGGVQLAGRMIAAALAEMASANGWQIDLFSLNDPPGRQQIRFGGTAIPFRGFGRAKVKFVLAALAAARKPALACSQPRIVLAAHPNLAVPAAWMRAFAPSSSPIRSIVVAHGIEVWQPLPASRRRALLRANQVAAPSRYTVEQLCKVQSVPAEKVSRLPWPLDPEFLRLADSRGAMRAPRGFPEGRVVLAVGRWASTERYKGADELIAAVAQSRLGLPDLHLALVGSGDDVRRLRQLAGASGAGAAIHFFEGLTQEELAGCYAQSEIFALPSTGEGFGFVFLEAMAFGKPVIGALAGGVTDLIEDGVDGLLVSGGDARKLATAVEAVLRDEPLRRKMGARGAAKVRAEFSFARFRENLAQLIERARDHH